MHEDNSWNRGKIVSPFWKKFRLNQRQPVDSVEVQHKTHTPALAHTSYRLQHILTHIPYISTSITNVYSVKKEALSLKEETIRESQLYQHCVRGTFAYCKGTSLAHSYTLHRRIELQEKEEKNIDKTSRQEQAILFQLNCLPLKKASVPLSLIRAAFLVQCK